MKYTLSSHNNGFKIIDYIFIFIFFQIFVTASFVPLFNTISLYFILPMLFVYSLLNSNQFIFKYKPLLIFLIYFIWSLFTSIKSKNIDSTIDELIKIASVFILSYIIIYFTIRNYKYIFLFFLFYTFKFITVFLMGYSTGLAMSPSERYSTDLINANTFGYFGFYAILSSFFIWIFSFNNKSFFISKKQSYFAYFIVISCMSVISCFYAASRAGIIISISTFIILILLYYLYPFSIKNIFKIIILFFIGLFIFNFSMKYYEGSILEKRNKIEYFEANEERFFLVEEALTIAKDNFILGVGPGNYINYSKYSTFSHNTFLEIFVNNGLVGLIIFISLIMYYIKRCSYLYSLSYSSRKIALYFYSFISIFIFYNFFYVFHITLFLMSFFFLITIFLDRYIYINKNNKYN